jgi:hypothetical protein
VSQLHKQLSLDEIVNMLGSDSRQVMRSIYWQLGELGAKAIEIEQDIVDFSRKNGSEGRFIFLHWALSHRRWSDLYAETVAEGLVDLDLVNRSQAMGLILKRGVPALTSVAQVVFSSPILSTTEALSFAKSRMEQISQEPYAEGWQAEKLGNLRSARAIWMCARFINGERLTKMRVEHLSEDSAVFDYLIYYHKLP